MKTRNQRSLLFAAVALLFIHSAYAQAPDFVWATSAGRGIETNYSTEEGSGIATDSAGNSYVAGGLTATNASFGTNLLTSQGGVDALILKLDPSGNILWAKTGGGKANDRSVSIAVDGSGNSYLAGYTQSTNVTFGTTVLTNITMAGNGSAFFLVKYDPNGNLLWVRVPDQNYQTTIESVGVDGAGAVYLAGGFRGTNVVSGTTLIANGFFDVLILKYDSEGNLVWAKQTGGQRSDSAAAIAVIPSGAFAIAGTFLSTNLTFGAYTLTNLNFSFADIFVAKYDSNGVVTWAASTGTPNDPDRVHGLAMDKAGKVCIAGSFTAEEFYFGTTVLTQSSNSHMQVFIAKYDVSGNPMWARQSVGGSFNEPMGVVMDDFGNCYVTGYFGSTNVAFGGVVLTNASQGLSVDDDVFVAKYDDVGNVVWAQRAGGDNVDNSSGIACDAVGNCYITGWFQGTNAFYGMTPLTSHYVDLFVAKIPTDLPQLTAKIVGNQIVLSWSAGTTGFVLESNTNLSVNSWESVVYDPAISNGVITVSKTISGSEKFFRLRK